MVRRADQAVGLRALLTAPNKAHITAGTQDQLEKSSPAHCRAGIGHICGCESSFAVSRLPPTDLLIGRALISGPSFSTYSHWRDAAATTAGDD